ncbi:sarcosine oxidase subunit gamma [Pseudooceanicola sp. MF1-13]|uniref:sarcosine oxidase subunit gamma n=1 Tax=Pseudooceanicola sp. MF1-13 TaxID=3379095 RepID=UPI003891F4B6
MSDPVTALKNATANGPVTVSETGPHGMLTLRGKLDDAGIAKAIQTATGTAAPEARKMSANGDTSVLWLSPDEAMVICPRADLKSVQEKLTSALGSAHALVADMSDARATFRISGDDAHVREVMARLIPVDMSTFEVGEVRRTRMAQIAAANWMPEAGVVQLVCFRSVAQYAFDLLKDAAASPRVF